MESTISLVFFRMGGKQHMAGKTPQSVRVKTCYQYWGRTFKAFVYFASKLGDISNDKRGEQFSHIPTELYVAPSHILFSLKCMPLLTTL